MQIGLAILVVGVLLVLGISHRARYRDRIERWARDAGFKLLRVERRTLRRGPFFLRTSENQEVFHVVIRDRRGTTRRGYVRVGGWFLGLSSNRVDVEWEA